MSDVSCYSQDQNISLGSLTVKRGPQKRNAQHAAQPKEPSEGVTVTRERGEENN